MFGKKSSDVGILCTDFELFVRVVLDGFNLPCEPCPALFADDMMPVLRQSEPAHGCNRNNCASYDEISF